MKKLVNIYNRWGEKKENKNLSPLASADEVLWNETGGMLHNISFTF